MWVRDRPLAGRVPGAPLTRERPNEKEIDMAKDKSKTNVATSGYTPVQVGKVSPRAKDAKKTPPATGKPKTPGATTNVVSGNARVGLVADTIVGDLHVQM